MGRYVKDYPRPQLKREDWQLLDGAWKFGFDESMPMTIQVPYTYETELGGLDLPQEEREKAHKVVWYQRSITVREMKQERLMLHFEGVDFEAKVWVNGKLAGSHRGGYARFSFDITELVHPGENVITLWAEDSFDTAQPRGKQRWKDESFACWYVQTTGIWKSVWMEYVPEEYIRSLKITPMYAEKTVVLEAEIACDREDDGLMLEAVVTYEGRVIRRMATQVTERFCRLEIDVNREDLFEWGIMPWSPSDPCLYDVELKLSRAEEASIADHVTSYFGMRDIRIDGQQILLNGSPLYQRLILDQGYWAESHLTPPSEEALIRDIDSIRAMGYNGLRKHQKIEDERFLYWCDVKGMLVWSEMAASYHYSDYAVEEFTKEWMEIVRQNYSHPCIITWTPFNESWGVPAIKVNRTQQHFTEAIYHLTKSFDPYRPVIVNDGWEHTISDILTLHDYEELGEVLFRRYTDRKDEVLSGKIAHCGHRGALSDGFTYQGQPVIISEYGGIAFNEDRGWGYGNKVTSKEDFIKRFDDITTAIKKLPYVCGFCYTQVSDVQQEINGLMDEKRNFKVEPEILKEINERFVEPEYKACR